MGTSSRATQQRAPPSSLRTQKGTALESGAWRLRSRSYSHDNELYRMGLRKTAQGEWAAVDNAVPTGLAAAMREMRIRNATRIKREPSVDVDMERVGNGEEAGEGDVAEETVVFEYEEIRVYLDVEREIVGGHVYVDEEGMKVETVMRSVETKPEFVVDVKMRDDGSGDPPDSTPSEGRLSLGARDSLASISEGREEDEDCMDVDATDQDVEEALNVTEATGVETTPPKTKLRRKWSDPEIQYVGALLDGGYKLSSIVDLFHERFPDADIVTIGSLGYCRERILYPKFSEHLAPIRLLANELGLTAGKWHNMDKALKVEEERLLLLTQEGERQTPMDIALPPLFYSEDINAIDYLWTVR